MTRFADTEFVDELQYGKEAGVEGRGKELMLWAIVLELCCSQCKEQARWRGRTREAVTKVAQLAGWLFVGRMVRCPKHSGLPVHEFNDRVKQPVITPRPPIKELVSEAVRSKGKEPLMEGAKPQGESQKPAGGFEAPLAASAAYTADGTHPTQEGQDSHGGQLAAQLLAARTRKKRQHIVNPPHCTYPKCTDPIAPKEEWGGRGRVTRCSKHLKWGREAVARHYEKKRRLQEEGGSRIRFVGPDCKSAVDERGHVGSNPTPPITESAVSPVVLTKHLISKQLGRFQNGEPLAPASVLKEDEENE